MLHSRDRSPRGGWVCEGNTYPLRSPSSGYAAEVVWRSRVQNLVLGAPRYQHTGLAVMFRENAGTWESNGFIKGSQVSAEYVEHKCANRGTLGAWDSSMGIIRCHVYPFCKGAFRRFWSGPKNKLRIWECCVFIFLTAINYNSWLVQSFLWVSLCKELVFNQYITSIAILVFRIWK